jgi:hypothetical protein
MSEVVGRLPTFPTLGPGVAGGKRSKEHRIDDAEKRRIGSYAERQSGDGDGREAGILAQQPQRKA